MKKAPFKMKGSPYKNLFGGSVSGTGFSRGIKNGKRTIKGQFNPSVRIGGTTLGYEMGGKVTGPYEKSKMKKTRNITANVNFAKTGRFSDKGLVGSISGKYGSDKKASVSLGFGNKPYKSYNSCGPGGCRKSGGSRGFSVKGYATRDFKKKSTEVGAKARYGWFTGKAGFNLKTKKPTVMGGIKIPFGKIQ